MEKIDIGIDAGRVLYGLSRIGYTTSAAICDIVDNSVRANANNINLIIKKEREDLSDVKRDNVEEYIIIDDGHGMNEERLRNAVKLGSSEDEYESGSLAKFGLGLKSASFSQGNTLHVISSDGNANFKKLTVSLSEIMATKNYHALKDDVSTEENAMIDEYLKDGHGTIIKIADIRKDDHPSVKNTVDELVSKVGIIYYYFMKEKGLKISIGERVIKPIDPLFIDEAEQNGNLNEFDWKGLDVKWIEKKQDLVIDDEKNITVSIEITQLPYPPRFKIEEPNKGKDAEIRDKYLIGANNYGFYVYRNKRLISWADRLDNIIPYDQDYYAFRGRILITSEADDFFNIDVKKSVISLSDEAWKTISDFSKEAKNKSKQAWNNAGKSVKEIVNKEPNTLADEIVSDFNHEVFLPGDVEISDDELRRRFEQIKTDMQAKIKVISKLHKEDRGESVPENFEPSEKEITEAIKGELDSNLNKIFRVISVEDNLLWEPYYDSDMGSCVRVNKLHRFARLIYEDNSENKDLQIIMDLFLLQLSEAEIYAYQTLGNYKYEEIKGILREFRRIISEYLANLARRKEHILPPFSSNLEY